MCDCFMYYALVTDKAIYVIITLRFWLDVALRADWENK